MKKRARGRVTGWRKPTERRLPREPRQRGLLVMRWDAERDEVHTPSGLVIRLWRQG